ncbi:MAG TPA: class I SAM-dependent rRNA methyltransferase [Burkholderiales bacterium]|nr:class I SAM-dependent rRNA methyltransferase [Burkholderiales bacterium]
MKRIVLKPGREKSLLRRHPWVFSGAIARIDAGVAAGDTVRIESHDGGFLALAACNPQANIAARVWDWREATVVGADFFRARLGAALAMRRALVAAAADGAERLVHGESDGLPGVIADRYADVVVVQLSSAGANRWRDAIIGALRDLTQARAVYERSDADVMELEGLAPRAGLVAGSLDPAIVDIREGGIRLRVDVANGHKTGFYLDQRDNRARVGHLARGREVLNCFCYTGGFSLHALAQDATSVMSVDSSADALRRAREHVALNGLPQDRCEWTEADVFQHLRKLRDRGRQFDLIVLDPPKFAPTAASAERAARGYKDINLLAFRLLRPGGLLATFSCSGGVSADLFRKIVAGAALDAGVQAQVVEQFHAAPDHPVSLAFPEGEYLKGLLCRIE